MKRAVCMSVLTLATVQSASGQSDTEQILRLLQKMDERLEAMENRVDRLDGGSAPSSNSVAPAAPSRSAVPGWRLSIAPLTSDGKPGDTPIARATIPIGQVRFDQHFKQGPVTDFVNYEGSAFFAAKMDGRYSFNIAVEPPAGSGDLCRMRLRVEETELITPERFPEARPYTASGGIELQQGNLLLTYDVSCWNRLSNPSGSIQQSGMNRYKQIAYHVTVLGPDDDALRDFEPDELFVLKK